MTAQYEVEETTDPTITVGSVSASAGDTVQIAISVKNNPGILGMTLKLTYDESVMTLTGASNGAAMSALTMTAPGKFVSGCNFVWYAMDLTESDIKDGEVLVLTFQILEGAPSGSYPIQVSYTAGDIFDCDWNDLVITLNKGIVTIN